ncbi:U32 family peptidase [Thermosyntropha sp.]|uniref:U32 family peptidase n=1 Tax=Thermosyntropha sp. TaxID=2740820 RepID=UPI0025CD1807|nr:U32 family peptidase [Thermosyntropha sp.]MBO8158593.1 U32 family peptidase [Thermosyntropha sp.]
MELLAPAGNFDSFVAGIENGADAVYLGGKILNARQGAENFSENEIKEAVHYAHIRDKKIYITINTLIDNKEFEPALDYLYKLYCLGIDAVIVQDLGFMKAILKILPDMRVHASTQMTVHNEKGAELLYNEGVKRAVLAREMTLPEIKSVHEKVPELELEVFVHGALCYSYSGQCLFSSMVGGRSGNRGRCAQPCRLSYELYSGRDKKPLAQDKGRYILSPADLCLIDYLPQLKEAGVTSLKIEGRMKRPEYVAVVTRTYRRALDILKEGKDYTITSELKKDLLKIFNRNLSTGYLFLDDNFLSAMRPNNRGVNVGRVLKQDKDFTTYIKLTDEVRLGDGLEIWVSKGPNPAFIVKEMKVDGVQKAVAGKGDIITIRLDARVFQGDRVFKTHDEKLISSALSTIKPDQTARIGLEVKAYLEEGKPLILEFTDENGHNVIKETRTLLEKADKHGLNRETLREKIDRLGNTPFYLKKFDFIGLENSLIVPFSDINETRRRACKDLCRIYAGVSGRLSELEYNDSKQRYFKEYAVKDKNKKERKIPCLSITVSGISEAYAAARAGADRIYLALEKIAKPRQIDYKKINQKLLKLNKEYPIIIPALPRIQRTGDFVREILHGFEEVLAGNLGTMKWCLDQGTKVRLDYSLNVFNQHTLDYFVQKGAKGVCLSPELSFKQLEDFEDLSKAELLVHGELVIMLSRYCHLPYLLGGSRDKCPRHCLKDDYYIKDAKGYEFPVMTDAYCNYYVFNSRTLCLIEDLPRIKRLFPEGIRIEGRRMNAHQVEETVRIYRNALDKWEEGQGFEGVKYKERLKELSNSQFTKCHYYRGVL